MNANSVPEVQLYGGPMDGAFVTMLAFPPVFRAYHGNWTLRTFLLLDPVPEPAFDVYHLRYINGKPRYDYAGVEK